MKNPAGVTSSRFFMFYFNSITPAAAFDRSRGFAVRANRKAVIVCIRRHSVIGDSESVPTRFQI